MENKDKTTSNFNNEVLAVNETTTEKKTCKHCGKTLPINMFSKRGIGHRNICINCECGDNGFSERFKQFTSRELMEELRLRGFKGVLKRVKVEELTI